MSNEIRKPKPQLEFDQKYASTEPSQISADIHAEIIHAITNKHVLTLTLRPHLEKFGEPHIYGVSDGHPTLLLYNEEFDPPWLVIDVRQVDKVKPWPERHFKKRPVPAEYEPDR
jgi:hypothetical protein